MYANPGIAALFRTDCGKKKWGALAGVLWRDALAGRSAFTEEVSLGLEGLWRGALADALARCSAFKDALAGRSAFCGDPPWLQLEPCLEASLSEPKNLAFTKARKR